MMHVLISMLYGLYVAWSAHHVRLLGSVHPVGVLSQGVVAQVLHLLHKDN